MSYWTDKYFGSLYHEIYSKHLLDPQRSLEEASFASHVLDLGRRQVLDVACGFGRHARLLAQSNRVLALDRSADYVRAARENLPKRAAENLALARADMRELPLAAGSMDAAVMLFNSFGYFGDDGAADAAQHEAAAGLKQQVWKLPSVFYERQLVDSSFGRFKDPEPETANSDAGGHESAGEDAAKDLTTDANLQVLQEVFRVLKPGGGFLLEVPNRRLLLEAVAENPRRLLVLDEYEIHEQFEWAEEQNRLRCKTRFGAGEREESVSYSLRLYEPEEIRDLLALAGFRVVRTFGDYEGGRFGRASSDVMLIHGRKPVRTVKDRLPECRVDLQ